MPIREKPPDLQLADVGIGLARSRPLSVADVEAPAAQLLDLSKNLAQQPDFQP